MRHNNDMKDRGEIRYISTSNLSTKTEATTVGSIVKAAIKATTATTAKAKPTTTMANMATTTASMNTIVTTVASPKVVSKIKEPKLSGGTAADATRTGDRVIPA